VPLQRSFWYSNLYFWSQVVFILILLVKRQLLRILLLSKRGAHTAVASGASRVSIMLLIVKSIVHVSIDNLLFIFRDLLMKLRQAFVGLKEWKLNLECWLKISND
jgi:hypothetical protein